MINYLLLTLTCIAVFAFTLCQKQYANRYQAFYPFFSMMALSAAAVFACTVTHWEFNGRMLLYASFFALPYLICVISEMQALSRGPLALFSLVISFSLLLPTFYGILFLQEPVTPTFIIGIVLVCITLLLVGWPQKGEKLTKITPVWLILVGLAFVGNGMCSVTQRLGQEKTGNVSMMMLIALLEIALVNLLLTFLSGKRPERKKAVRHGWYYAVGAGLFNGLTNYLVTVLNTRMSASIMFPVIGAMGLILSFIASLLFYKEKYSRLQLAGFALSVVSVVILNL